MTKVAATGVFDILHPGHILFLAEAKKLGGELIVILARDENIKKHKRQPVIPENQRLEVIRALKVVDAAVLGDLDDMFKPIIELKPDIIAIGPNQAFLEKDLEKKLKERNINAKVVRIKTLWEGELNSTGKIIEKIKKNQGFN
jgi:FAD synthetase